MSDEDALLAAICEQPDEDAPRLAFADWLQEQGDNVNAAWARFIRGQIQRAAARMLDSPYWKERWLERLGLPIDRNSVFNIGLEWGSWERGFPERLFGRFEALRPALPCVIGRVPLRELALYCPTDAEVEELTAWAGLRSLSRLTITGNHQCGEPSVCALAGCASLSGLQELVLEGVTITDRAADAILDSPHLAGLGNLRVRWIGQDFSEQARERLTARFGTHTVR